MNWDRRSDELREHVKSLPGKKNTREWCKGKVGRHHQVEMRKRPPIQFRDRVSDNTCKWWPWGLRSWHCYHEIVCVNCGKILNHTLGSDCPDWTPDPEVTAETQ